MGQNFAHSHASLRLRGHLNSARVLAFSQHAGTAQSGPIEPAYLHQTAVVRVVDSDTIEGGIDLGFFPGSESSVSG